MEEQIVILDNSGDKKYFSQLPHYILNHSTAVDQALYWQMKRYSGENGKCFATQETLMKKMGVGIKAYRKSLQYLLDKGWIKFIGMTGGKTRPIKTYSITDIWKLNILHYEKIPTERTVSLKDTGQKHNKIPAESTIEEEQREEERKTTGEAPADLTYEKGEDEIPIGEFNRKQAKERGYKGEHTNPILAWAENRMHKRFTLPLKQKKAISSMLHTGYDPADIQAKWEELEKHKYWGKEGFDFTTVLTQISKAKNIAPDAPTTSYPEAPKVITEQERKRNERAAREARKNLKKSGVLSK